MIQYLNGHFGLRNCLRVWQAVILAAMFAISSSGCGGSAAKTVAGRPILAETEEELEAEEGGAPAKPPAAATTPAATGSDAAPSAADTPAQPPATETPADPNPGANKLAAAIQSQKPAEESPALPPAATEESEEEAPRPAIKLPWSAKRPDDVALWKPGDYIDALDDADPRLLEAVSRLGTTGSGNDETARLLTRLLEPDESLFGTRRKTQVEEGDGDAEKTEVRRTQELGAAIIDSLGANRTETADATLKQILRGNFKSDFQDDTLTRAALKALANNPSQRHESMIYTVLTSPTLVRPVGRGVVAAEDLRRECLQVIAPVISDSLRTAVAKHLVKRDTTEADRQELLPLVQAPTASNLEAQVILYASNQIQATTRSQLQGYLNAFAGEAIDTLLDTKNDDPNRGNQAGINLGESGLTPGEAALAARALWGTNLAPAVALRLRGVGELQAETQLLTLACGLPIPEVRSQVQAAIEHRWLEGTGILGSTEGGTNLARDPGFLLVMKTVPRDEDPEKRMLEGGRAKERAANKRNSGTQRSAGSEAVRKQNLERVQKENDAKYAWLAATEKMVRSLNDRFRRASVVRANRGLANQEEPVLSSSGQDGPRDGVDPFEANALSDDEVSPARDEPAAAAPGSGFDATAGRDRMPFPIHPGAVVTAEYHSRWPDDLPAGLGAVRVAPLDLHYVRMEVDDRFTKLEGYYHRKLNEIREPADWLIDRGVWLENVEVDESTGLQRSIDVFISRYAEQPPLDRDAREKLVVELLIVAAPDPRSGESASQDVARSDDERP